MQNSDKVFWIGIVAAIFFAVEPVLAEEPVIVEFRSTNDQGDRFPIEAKVERQSLLASTTWELGTTQDGFFRYRETRCSEARYRLSPLSQLLVPNDLLQQFDWRQCDPEAPLITVEHSTSRLRQASYQALEAAGLSHDALMLVRGERPESFRLPDTFSDSYKIISQSLANGQPGAAAKTSDQLASIYRKAGLVAEARAFSEIAVGIATVSAWNDQVNQPGTEEAATWEGQLVLPSDGGSSAWVSLEAIDKVRKFQGRCGVSANGVVGWDTHGCLAGGKDFVLPGAISSEFQAVDVLRENPDRVPPT
ncbi:MAG: hypothetical protein RIC18_00395 [Hoeflea sp.]|uniref:hypothetical protein n=1 Tax=Hoeflea sp. TaxID=1940281 RepID=UPI0032ED7BF9